MRRLWGWRLGLRGLAGWRGGRGGEVGGGISKFWGPLFFSSVVFLFLIAPSFGEEGRMEKGEGRGEGRQ